MYFLSAGAVDIFITVEKPSKKQENAEENNPLAIENKEIRIERLREGSYFGEVALITKLKRTATARAIDYTTLAYIDRENFEEVRREFPQVYLNFKRKIRGYEDQDFSF